MEAAPRAASLSLSERIVPLPPLSTALTAKSGNAVVGLWAGVRDGALSKRAVSTQLLISLLPALAIAALLAVMYFGATAPTAAVDTTGLVQAGGAITAEEDKPTEASGLQEPPKEAGGLSEPPVEGAAVAPAASPSTVPATAAPPATAAASQAPAKAAVATPAAEAKLSAEANARDAVPIWYWIVLAAGRWNGPKSS